MVPAAALRLWRRTPLPRLNSSTATALRRSSLTAITTKTSYGASRRASIRIRSANRRLTGARSCGIFRWRIPAPSPMTFAFGRNGSADWLIIAQPGQEEYGVSIDTLVRRAQLFRSRAPVPPLSAANRLREHRDRAKEDWVNLSRFGMNNHETLGWCLIHCKPSKWRRAFFLHRTNLFCSSTFTGGQQQS